MPKKTSQTFRDAVQGIIADGMELLPGIEILAAQRLLIPCEMTMVILASAPPPPLIIIIINSVEVILIYNKK